MFRWQHFQCGELLSKNLLMCRASRSEGGASFVRLRKWSVWRGTCLDPQQGVEIVLLQCSYLFRCTFKRHVIQHFYNNLSPHGLFFLGHSESLFGITEDLGLIHLPSTTAYMKIPSSGGWRAADYDSVLERSVAGTTLARRSDAQHSGSGGAVDALSGQPLDQPDLHKVVDLLSQDKSLTAQCLHMADSPLWGHWKEVDSLRGAVVALGFQRLREIVLSSTF